MFDPRVERFRLKVAHLQRSLRSDRHAGVDPHRAQCSIGSFRSWLMVMIPMHSWSVRSLLGLPSGIGVSHTDDVESCVVHRLLAFASPSRYLSFAPFMLIASAGPDPAQRLAYAATRGHIAPDTTCMVWLDVRDLVIEFGQLRAILSMSPSAVVHVLRPAAVVV